MVIDKFFISVLPLPAVLWVLLPFPSLTRGRVQESCTLPQVRENFSSGWERRVPSSYNISNGLPGNSSSTLLWQICAVGVFYGGILWDGL